MTLAFLNIGTQEMILIVIVILILFGGKKLPELARGLGRGIREFKDASEDIKREISDQINNFEKDLDVKAEETASNPAPHVDVEKPVESLVKETPVEEATAPVEKKFPQFTPPANTVQHDPGAHPVDDSEYYKYGYKDYFEEENKTEGEDSKETSIEEQPKDNPSQNV